MAKINTQSGNAMLQSQLPNVQQTSTPTTTQSTGLETVQIDITSTQVHQFEQSRSSTLTELDGNFVQSSQAGAVVKGGSVFQTMLQSGEDFVPPIMREATVPPATGQAIVPDVLLDADQDGVTDAARVGVPGMQVPPPPAELPRLPNLTADERAVETRFNTAFEQNPEAVTQQYFDMVTSGQLGKTNVFSTDDAKLLSPDYNPPADANVTQEERLDRKSRYNTMVHQAGNAIAKRAFLQHLDQVVAKLPPEQRTVLVTAGGVAAGKGYAIENVAEVNELAEQIGAVWDTAGEQNSTELPWVLQECEKRGIKATFAFVYKDSSVAWEHPQFGVLPRAAKKGRMVDAKPFAESYAIGSQNFHNFYQKQANNPNADFIFLSCNGTPELLDGMPPEALDVNADELYEACMAYMEDDAVIEQHQPRAAVLRGATAGERIWQQS